MKARDILEEIRKTPEPSWTIHDIIKEMTPKERSTLIDAISPYIDDGNKKNKNIT